MALAITDDKILDILSGINGQLASLNGNMSVVLEKLSTHELRLTQHDKEIDALKDGKKGFKDTLIALLVKGIVASIFVIGTISGAGTMLKGIFGL